MQCSGTKCVSVSYLAAIRQQGMRSTHLMYMSAQPHAYPSVLQYQWLIGGWKSNDVTIIQMKWHLFAGRNFVTACDSLPPQR